MQASDSFTPQLLECCDPLKRLLGRTQCWSRCLGQEKNLMPFTGNQTTIASSTNLCSSHSNDCIISSVMYYTKFKTEFVQLNQLISGLFINFF